MSIVRWQVRVLTTARRYPCLAAPRQLGYPFPALNDQSASDERSCASTPERSSRDKEPSVLRIMS